MVRRLVRRDDRDGHVLRLLITRDFRLHRDYDNRDGAGIYVYHDKIVFVNHNRPEPPTTIADLNERIEFPDRVYLNPEVKEMFHALGLIESYGSGIRRAKAALEENGSPALVFGPSNDTDALTKVTMGICVEFAETDTRVKRMRPTRDSGTTRGSGGMENKSDKTKALLDLLASNPRITQEQMVERLGISRSTLTARLAELQSRGLVRRVGARENGYWVVPRSPEE